MLDHLLSISECVSDTFLDYDAFKRKWLIFTIMYMGRTDNHTVTYCHIVMIIFFAHTGGVEGPRK